jgi:hypothetical protein
MKRTIIGMALVGAMALTPSVARANTADYSGTLGNLSADATFDFTGTTLTITLTNTADPSTVLTPSDILSGLFFTLTGDPTATPVSATIVSGDITQSANCTTPCATATNVGGEWSYADAGLAAAAGTNEGISASGYLPVNADSGNFNGSNLQDPTALDGLQFGIVPTGFVAGQGNGGVDNQALIVDHVTFVLTLPTALDVDNLSNVYFTYGTLPEALFGGCADVTGANCEPVEVGFVPEPATLALLGSGLGVLSVRLRKRKKNGAKANS